MLFPTVQFALFFALVYPANWLLRARPLPWRILILAASYLFYGLWDWRFVGLLLLSTVVNTLLGRRIADEAAGGGRSPTLVLAIIFNLAVLGLFKYYGFFIELANALLRSLGAPARLPFLEVVVPVGISFFTFQALSYVIDIARRQMRPVPLLDFAVYLAFFPHLVAGPIVRAAEFLPQLVRLPTLTRRAVSAAALLIAAGFFKKVVVASYVGTAIVDPVFGAPAGHSALEIIVGIYAYAVQIYADFSGYTDMAIGIALLLGIRFPQNFDRPYSAVSLQDFWRRWHMTLSRWLRDYLYIGLGGNRYGRLVTYRNLFLTMLLGGLWHGAAWTFVAWGAFHGIGLAVERWLGERRTSRPTGLADAPIDGLLTAARPWAARLLTFHLVCIGWVFFRAESLGVAGTLLGRSLTAWGPAPLVGPGLVGVVAGALAVQLLPPALGQRIEERFAGLPLAVQGAAVGAFLALAVALGPTGVAPFIYYQF